ncbi:MAG: sugar transferase [Acidobacteriia bacterium]|nr:sugar transferase [Terriglobia bacterium]
MSNVRHRLLISSLKTLDSLVLVAAFGFASLTVLYETGQASLGEFLSMRIKVQNFILFSGLLLGWRLIFSGMHLYDSRRASGEIKAADGIKAVSVSTLFLGALALLFDIRLVDPIFLLTFWISAMSAVVGGRLLIDYLLARARRKGSNLRHVLMVGTNRRIVSLARKLESRPEFGYRVIGFVDRDWPGLESFGKTGYRIVSDFEGVADFLRKNVVDEVIVGLPLRSHYTAASQIAGVCEAQGIVVTVLPLIVEPKRARCRAEDFEGAPFITLYTGPRDELLLALKRIMDFGLSLTMLVLLSPLLALVTLLIKLLSPGPVFFIQERLGLSKRRFRLYKFRTMVPDAERKQAELEGLNEASGPVFKIKDDPRITPFGKLLRKTSIDELPQLLNVLKGDMSLVGPRPLPIRDYEGFDQDWHRRRFSVRPGITCFWQMSGRSSISFDKWMELDMRYIDEWSLWLDLQILFGTIPAVLKGSGAA